MQLALATGKPSHGVKGYTPLVDLPKFDLVWGVCPDYMHCVLEGVTKQLADIWFSSVKSAAYIGAPSQLRMVTSRLLNLKPPQFFTRLPRTVEDRSLWKASEWKWWLLFYSVPCLHGILPTDYLEHFCLLVNGIFLLLKDNISRDDLKVAMSNLSQFVYQVEELYGLEAMTFNIHQLVHLPQSVLQLGPLWSHSTFVFESGNGSLLNLVSDANGVPLQVLERFTMTLQLRRFLQTMSLSQKARALCETMTGYNAKENPEHKPLGKGRFLPVGDHEAALFSKLGQHPKNVVEYKRLLLKGRSYHVQSYNRTKRTCNSYLKSTDGLYYVLDRVLMLEDGMCYLVCQQLKCQVHRKVSHMYMTMGVEEKVLLNTSEVDRICVAMNVDNVLYVSEIPNMQERE